MIKKLFSLFAIRKEERCMAIVLALILVALNALVIAKYASVFTPLTKYYWPLFIHNFHISGFDPIPYSIISDYSTGYNVYRHPLLWLFYYPIYALNQALMWLTGVNCAIFITPFIQTCCAVYAFIFLYRLLKDIISLNTKDAWLLCWFFFSFAYILVASIVPDHFINSLFCLSFTLYIAGLKIKSQKLFNKRETILLFIITAGITLSNGLKIFWTTLLTNGKKFFQWRYFVGAIIIPALAIWCFANWEYAQLVHPIELQKKKAQEERKRKKEQKTLQLTLTQQPTKATNKAKENAHKPNIEKQTNTTPSLIIPPSFAGWMDISTNRWTTITENLLGESLQLHPTHLLGDVLLSRPIIVPYTSIWNYMVEACIIVLFALGLWYGRHKKIIYIAGGYWLFDMCLHLGLGFGIREIYIMTPHWATIIPLAIAFFLKAIPSLYKNILRGTIALLTAFLGIWNISLIAYYLLQ